MKKFGAFLARKIGLPELDIEIEIEPTKPINAQPPDNPLELDEELFSAIGAQTGAEYEAVRTLLLDASAKAGELGAIKSTVDRLVDPVSKMLGAIEDERAEKFSLQTALNNTRAAYGKLRNQAAECEARLDASLRECEELRRELADAQERVRAETAKAAAETAIDAVARRAQIVDLEARLAQETGEREALRAEKRRLDERLAVAEKRIITLESEFDAARQRLLLAEGEKRTQQELLDKTNAEKVHLSRKLSELQTALDTSQDRLRQTEAKIADLTEERARLAGALEDANERHANEHASQHTRFDALATRAEATDKLLSEARNKLVACNEQVREYDECVTELMNERNALQKRLADMDAECRRRYATLDERDEKLKTMETRWEALNRAFAAKEVALERAEGSIDTLRGRLKSLEQTAAADRQTAEQSVDELGSALQREKMGHAVTQGKLESARNELARVMRALMTLERERPAPDTAMLPHAANAA